MEYNELCWCLDCQMYRRHLERKVRYRNGEIPLTYEQYSDTANVLVEFFFGSPHVREQSETSAFEKWFEDIGGNLPPVQSQPDYQEGEQHHEKEY